MGERSIPILPCHQITPLAEFYQAIGFEITHQQHRPYEYLVVERGDIELSSGA